MSEAFVPFLRTVGRGPRLSRPLAREEARAAMAHILAGEVAPEQLGGFLLVLRTRGETAPEIAGFVEAVRATLEDGAGLPVELDWPSYADRHRRPPWFVLAALLVARAGVRVLMHGLAGEGPATTRAALEALGVPLARSIAEAGEQLERSGFAYLPIERFAPAFARLFALRPILGVRTAINTTGRALDPFKAPFQIQGVFHPPYVALQVEVQRLLGRRCGITFKGRGGEAQRDPDKPTRVVELVAGEVRERRWPPVSYAGPRHPWRDEPPELAPLVALWRGEVELPGPEAAVVATAALALHLTGRARDPEAALALARELWQTRRSPQGAP